MLVSLVSTIVLAGCTPDDRPSVSTERVTTGDVTQTISAPATVDAAARQDVAAGVSGVVVDVTVEDGARVSKGDVIVRLASSQVDLALQQAQAAQRAAGGIGGVRVDGGGDQTLAATDRAVAQLDRSTRPRLRQARQRARRIDARDERRAALAAVDAIEASYESTRAALLLAGRSLAAQQDATAESLSRALNQAVASATSGQRLQAEAAAAIAQRRQDELELRAPFAGVVQFGEASAADGTVVPGDLPPEVAGVVGSLGGLAGGQGGGTLRPGAPVTAGQTVFTVFSFRDLYVTAHIDEIDAPQAVEGQSAYVLVDAFPDLALDGIVERIAVASEAGTTGGVGYPARIRLLGAHDADFRLRRLRVGMTASAEIATKTVAGEMVVPSRALLRRDGVTVVFVVHDGVARQRPVEVLALGEDTAAVDSDLTPDDRVIVSGYEELADGDEVAVD